MGYCKTMNNARVLNFPTSLIGSLSLKLRFNLKIFWILSLILIICLSILYVFQINNLTSRAYQIKNSQREINKLSSQNEKLEIELAKSNSLTNIANLIEKFNFEKANKIHYIQILDNQIVKE